MTAHRRPTIAFSDAPRGTCRWCGEPILYLEGDKAGEPDRRRRWHPECVEIYNATDPREARRIVRKRDRAICAACHLDTRKLARELRGRGRGRTKWLRENGFVPKRSLWELDHIVPLIDGGTHALENLQTLCTPCHRTKTADEARLRAQSASPAPEAEPDATRVAEAAEPAPRAPDPAAADAPEPARRRREAAPRLERLLERADEVNGRIERLLARFP